MTLPITALTAAICAIMLLLTAIDTVRHRVRAKAAFGDAGDSKLTSAIRSHGNLAEHAPIVIIMIGVLESARANHWALTGVAVVFLAARALHIVGLYGKVSNGKPPPARSLGVIGTWLVMAVLIVWIFYSVIRFN